MWTRFHWLIAQWHHEDAFFCSIYVGSKPHLSGPLCIKVWNSCVISSNMLLRLLTISSNGGNTSYNYLEHFLLQQILQICMVLPQLPFLWGFKLWWINISSIAMSVNPSIPETTINNFNSPRRNYSITCHWFKVWVINSAFINQTYLQAFHGLHMLCYVIILLDTTW